jgi:hypothetical protein
MMSAYVDADSLRFPPTCPHCGRPAETTREIAAMRNLHALLEYLPPRLIDVPVCRDAVRRRRVTGVAAVVLTIAFMLVGGFFAAMLAIDSRWIGAALVAMPIAVLALAGRTGWDDALLDRRYLGVSARGAGGSRVRMHFSRDSYFSEWAAMNPTASSSAGAMGWRPPLAKAEEPRPTASMSNRAIPAIALAASAAVIALIHWAARGGGGLHLSGLTLLMAIAFLSAGGVVYPPVLWSIGAYGKHLPWWVKAIGWILFIGGAAAGFMLAISYGV